MAYEWKDQVVVITGAATGIGALVVKFIVEEGTKHVAVLDIDETAGVAQENELNAKYGAGKVKFYKCDVTNEELFLNIFKTVKEEQGYIDVVINNAGIMNDRPNVYQKAINVNVTALVTGTIQAIEYMRKDKGGRGGTVINISSIAGIHQSPLLPVYFATKSAVLMFSNCIGMDDYYSRTNVRVLTICFGATDTPLLSPTKLGSCDADYEHNLMRLVSEYSSQRPEFAAKGLVEVHKIAKSGTTWLIDDSKPAQDITSDVQQAYQVMSSKMSQS